MSHPPDLSGAVHRLARARVAVVGDVMLDRFVYGEVDRISPEAPIPVFRVVRESAMLGGAGNVARNLAAIGARAHLVAAVGEDAAAAEVEALLAELEVDASLARVAGRCTTVKVRHLAAGQQILRTDREDADALPAVAAETIAASTERALAEADVGLLSDYGKGVLARAHRRALIAAIRARGRFVVVDPKDADFTSYDGAHLVTPNQRELAIATGLSTRTEEEVVAAARVVLDRCAIDAVLATRGRDGMILVSRGEIVRLPAAAREVFDVSGAGDTVVAVCAAGIAAGLRLADAARLANAAAGVVVGKTGTAVAHPAEIVAALDGRSLARERQGLVPLVRLREQVDAWRREGLRIGFAHGRFERLEPGHVARLARARTSCDRLIAAVEADLPVRALRRGAGPVQPATARGVIVGALAAVDAAVLVDADVRRGLVEEIRPEVLLDCADHDAAPPVDGEATRRSPSAA